MTNLEALPGTDPTIEIRQQVIEATLKTKNDAVTQLREKKAVIELETHSLLIELGALYEDKELPHPERFPITTRTTLRREFDDGFYYTGYRDATPPQTLQIETPNLPEAFAFALASHHAPLVHTNYARILSRPTSEGGPKYVASQPHNRAEIVTIQVTEAYGYHLNPWLDPISNELCKAALTLAYLNLNEILSQIVEQTSLLSDLKLPDEIQRESYEKLLKKYVLEHSQARVIQDLATTDESLSPLRVE